MHHFYSEQFGNAIGSQFIILVPNVKKAAFFVNHYSNLSHFCYSLVLWGGDLSYIGTLDYRNCDVQESSDEARSFSLFRYLNSSFAILIFCFMNIEVVCILFERLVCNPCDQFLFLFFFYNVTQVADILHCQCFLFLPVICIHLYPLYGRK